MMGHLTDSDQVVKVGDVVEGRYRVIKTLGEGGMGTVFLAEHTLIKRRVAIKVLHSELATDADVVERFMNEARAAGTLGHPNIVESTDMGFTSGHVPYIVFEYLEGTLLTDEIYRVAGMPVRRAVWIAQQIASALRAAHNADIVHRDLKTDNIFLTDKDEALDHVKVLDFGISRFLEQDEETTQRGMVMGTPEFMAPEQIATPDNVDRRADIYALGVILYEMLEARRPFLAEKDPHEVLHKILNDDPPPFARDGIPARLAEMIIHKLLAKNPADRFQSMGDVEAALETFITNDNMKRRRTPMPMQAMTDADVARHSDLIPRPAMSRNTPWPGSDVIPTLTDAAISQMSLPTPPPVKRPWALYAVAGLGLVVGAVGLTLFMTSGTKSETVATPTPPPPVQPQPAPAPAAATQPASSKIAVQIDANVADARVTFRRRLSAAPATMQVTASDIVELVEVSAPGHKTVRYWLTFDRATHLTAKLPKGNGLVEASEEDTLVALGEVSAPTTQVAAATPSPAPAAEPAKPAAAAIGTVAAVTTAPPPKQAEPEQPKAMTVAKTDAPAQPARRKIGKSAADEQPAAPASIGALASIETSTPKDVPVVEHKEKKQEPIPEPAKEPAKADEPKQEPAVAKTEAPKAAPAIDQGTLSSVVGKNRPAVLKCFADGKKMNPQLKGTLTVSFQVDPAGNVKRPQVQTTITGAPLVAACVVKAAQTWKFPSRSDGQLASLAYPFVIN